MRAVPKKLGTPDYLLELQCGEYEVVILGKNMYNEGYSTIFRGISLSIVHTIYAMTKNVAP